MPPLRVWRRVAVPAARAAIAWAGPHLLTLAPKRVVALGLGSGYGIWEAEFAAWLKRMGATPVAIGLERVAGVRKDAEQQAWQQYGLGPREFLTYEADFVEWSTGDLLEPAGVAPGTVSLLLANNIWHPTHKQLAAGANPMRDAVVRIAKKALRPGGVLLVSETFHDAERGPDLPRRPSPGQIAAEAGAMISTAGPDFSFGGYRQLSEQIFGLQLIRGPLLHYGGNPWAERLRGYRAAHTHPAGLGYLLGEHWLYENFASLFRLTSATDAYVMLEGWVQALLREQPLLEMKAMATYHTDPSYQVRFEHHKRDFSINEEVGRALHSNASAEAARETPARHYARRQLLRHLALVVTAFAMPAEGKAVSVEEQQLVRKLISWLPEILDAAGDWSAVNEPFERSLSFLASVALNMTAMGAPWEQCARAMAVSAHSFANGLVE